MRDGGAGAQGGFFLRISPETWGLTSFLAAKVLDDNGWKMVNVTIIKKQQTHKHTGISYRKIMIPPT